MFRSPTCTVLSSQIRASGEFNANECVADFAKKGIDGSFNGNGIGIVLGHRKSRRMSIVLLEKKSIS
jgi:hypothetical protein